MLPRLVRILVVVVWVGIGLVPVLLFLATLFGGLMSGLSP